MRTSAIYKCEGCEFASHEKYIDHDSHFCSAPSVIERLGSKQYTGDSWRTPEWCPFRDPNTLMTLMNPREKELCNACGNDRAWHKEHRPRHIFAVKKVK